MMSGMTMCAAPQLEHPAEGVAGEQALADAQRRPRLAGEPRQIVDRIGRHRLLQPDQVVWLERAGDAQRAGIVPHRVQLDGDLHARADRLADARARLRALVDGRRTDVLAVDQADERARRPDRALAAALVLAISSPVGRRAKTSNGQIFMAVMPSASKLSASSPARSWKSS